MSKHAITCYNKLARSHIFNTNTATQIMVCMLISRRFRIHIVPTNLANLRKNESLYRPSFLTFSKEKNLKTGLAWYICTYKVTNIVLKCCWSAKIFFLNHSTGPYKPLKCNGRTAHLGLFEAEARSAVSVQNDRMRRILNKSGLYCLLLAVNPIFISIPSS